MGLRVRPWGGSKCLHKACPPKIASPAWECCFWPKPDQAEGLLRFELRAAARAHIKELTRVSWHSQLNSTAARARDR